MANVVFIVAGAIIGAVLFNGYDSGPWVGAAIGALAGWVRSLHRRIKILEQADRIVAEPTAPAPEKRQDLPVEAPADEAADADFLTAWQSADEEAAASEMDVPVQSRASEMPERHIAEEPSSGADKPEALERLFESIKRWCTTGNVPVKLGVLLSVFGVAFLVKEAMDRGFLVLPLEWRLAGVALFGIALTVIGWRLRTIRRDFALSVQGGGIAVIYITTYAAYSIYDLLPSVAAFFLCVVLTASAGVLSVLQNSRAMANFSVIGGFLAPVLTSSGSGNHVALFSYYAILNAAIFGIAWFKQWRELNVLGFLFTFGIGTAWGFLSYSPDRFASTEPFLILFVLMYTLIPVLFATRQQPRLKGFVDGTLLFGTPIVGFALQIELVGDFEYGLALSAVALAALYVSIATFLYQRRAAELRLMIEAFLSLGIVFLTIAIPLSLDARGTSATWALEGAAVVWLGLRQNRRLSVIAGIVLQLAAAVAFELQPGRAALGIPVLNGYCMGAMLIGLAGFFSARLFDHASRNGKQIYATLSWLALIWGAGWWFSAGFMEIEYYFSATAQPFALSASLALVAATALIAMPLASRFDWAQFNTMGLLLVPAMAFTFLIAAFEQTHPFARLGWAAWLFALSIHYLYLRRRESQFQNFAGALHTGGYWLLAGIAAAEFHWLADRYTQGIWPSTATFVAISALILATLRVRAAVKWPLQDHWKTYVLACCGGTLAALLLATTAANLNVVGDPAPLPYVPLLNPLTLASILAFIVLVRWYVATSEFGDLPQVEARYRIFVPTGFALLLLTMEVARTVHHWAGVPADWGRLADSTIFQASLSIVWGSTALLAMLFGAHRKHRAVWIGGAALMGIVVVKLFIVELGNTGTMGRVVSFLGVGLLLLIVGYFAPVPPRTEQALQN